MMTRRIDAGFAAAVLRANGATDLPAGITDAAGYDAYLHPDHDTAWRHHAELVHPYGATLIGFGNVEGGWIFLYDTRHRGANPMTYTDADHAAWRARADAAHPDRACLGCRDCDPVPGWSQLEPVGDTGWVRTRWIGGTDGQPRP